MVESSGQVEGSAAVVYEEFFVPALFQQWAPRIADALEPLAAGPVLDVACGTGVLARELARRIGDRRVCGVDCNQGMLDVGKGKAPGIDWRQGTAEALAFETGHFAAVGSQFGLMFFEDRKAALAEMWRVLAPGGTLAVAVWASLSDTPGYREMVELLRAEFGDAIAAELEAPFCLGDPAELQALFTAAGVAPAAVRTLPGTARFESIRAWVHTDVFGWTLAGRIDDEQYARLQHEAARALTAFVGDDGRVAFDSPAHIVTARKPDAP